MVTSNPEVVALTGETLMKLINLMLSVATLHFILVIAIGIIVDQYPCWIGVPNWD
jgi:hypothetical protein